MTRDELAALAATNLPRILVGSHDRPRLLPLRALAEIADAALALIEDCSTREAAAALARIRDVARREGWA